MTTRAYIRTDPALFMRKAVEQRYPIGAFAVFHAVLELAEEQPVRGRFRSERLLRLLLDDPTDDYRLGWGRHVRYLIDHGDLVRQPDGSLYVDGWDEWQEGDVTVTERMARLRSRKANARGRNGVTADVTPQVTVPVTVGVTVPIVSLPSERRAEAVAVAVAEAEASRAHRNGVTTDVMELQVLAEDLTQQPYAMQNVHSGLGLKAVTALHQHGRPRLEEVWRDITDECGGHPTLRQLVLGADNILNPIPGQRQETAKERKEREMDEARTRLLGASGGH